MVRLLALGCSFKKSRTFRCGTGFEMIRSSEEISKTELCEVDRCYVYQLDCWRLMVFCSLFL
jgi:hypothetical protein